MSEHIAWSIANGTYLADLLPLPMTEEALAVVCRVAGARCQSGALDRIDDAGAARARSHDEGRSARALWHDGGHRDIRLPVDVADPYTMGGDVAGAALSRRRKAVAWPRRVAAIRSTLAARLPLPPRRVESTRFDCADCFVNVIGRHADVSRLVHHAEPRRNSKCCHVVRFS